MNKLTEIQQALDTKQQTWDAWAAAMARQDLGGDAA